MSVQTKKARTARKTTIALVPALKKDLKALSKKDVFNANILSQIIKDMEWRLPNNWEMALEESLEHLYKYNIPLRQQTKDLFKTALEHYDRPNYKFRGADIFGEIYDELLRIYDVKIN